MKVDKDKVVSFHYTLTLDSGEMVDTSQNRGPVSFIVGHGQIIPGLEQKMMGMEAGDKKQIKVQPQDGYGERDDNRVQTVSRDRIPDEIELSKGMVLSGQAENGQKIDVRVNSFDDKEVELDLNHPLAGENLNFDTEVVDVREPSSEELEHGHVHS